MKKVILAASLFAPAIAFAQGLENLDTLLESIGDLIGNALPVVVAIALLVFFWGLVKYILSAGDETKKKDGQRLMIWSLVALFVMVSVWGLVGFIGDALDIEQGGSIEIPEVPGI
ncbi:MAG: hypothetical protein HYT69_00950 [Candidatus Zambryskibacteria bacterium]|nr:hypothetical protein [Candidatus Zambryskibacteria bacterium]